MWRVRPSALEDSPYQDLMMLDLEPGSNDLLVRVPQGVVKRPDELGDLLAFLLGSQDEP